jgi:predicted nucleic acid-binding protein
MARVSYLVDTDVLVDWLRDREWARHLILRDDVRLYCSEVTRKELLSKPGLKTSEYQRILRLMRRLRVLHVDSVIAAAASELLHKYASQHLRANDALIAATAWTKRLPLVTRNRKHYEFVAEIVLAEIL